MSTQQMLDQLVETLSKLSVLDLSKLKTMLEETWGVKAAAAPVMMAAPASPGSAAPVAVESTDFKVTLEAVPAEKKIGVIKVVREITGLGLKEAKDVVEGAPKVLKESCPKTEAEEIAKKVVAGGGKVTLQGL